MTKGPVDLSIWLSLRLLTLNTSRIAPLGSFSPIFCFDSNTIFHPGVLEIWENSLFLSFHWSHVPNQVPISGDSSNLWTLAASLHDHSHHPRWEDPRQHPHNAGQMQDKDNGRSQAAVTTGTDAAKAQKGGKVWMHIAVWLPGPNTAFATDRLCGSGKVIHWTYWCLTSTTYKMQMIRTTHLIIH